MRGIIAKWMGGEMGKPASQQPHHRPQRPQVDTHNRPVEPHAASTPSTSSTHPESDAWPTFQTARGRQLRLKLTVELNANVTPRTRQTLGPDDVMFDEFARIIEFALELIASPASCVAMMDLGRAIVRQYDPNRKYHKHDPEDLLAMFEVYKFFLSSLGGEFPPVVLTNRIPGDGMFSWYPADEALRRDSGIRGWVPRRAGTITMQRKMIDDIVTARLNIEQRRGVQSAERRAAAGLRFIAGITLAHELVHTWTHVFVSDEAIRTPVDMTFLRYRFNQNRNKPNESGESGRYWEYKVLGGIVEAFEGRYSPCGPRDCGDLYLVDEQEMARELRFDVVHQMLQRNFVTPLPTIGEAQAFGHLLDSKNLMANVRIRTLPQHIQDEVFNAEKDMKRRGRKGSRQCCLEDR